MNHHDVRLLQAIHGYPALSIMLPTHRTSPENRQDPIRVKNLVTEATKRLLSEFSQRDLNPLLSRLDKAVAGIDYQHTLDGLAIFVNQDFAAVFSLPFPPKERVVVDETFATRDLEMALNRAQRYWVLALSEQPTRLYEGTRETLIEVRSGGFPLTHGGPGGETRLPGGTGVSSSAYRDDQHRQFFRKVGAAFKQVSADDRLPLVLVGVDRYLAFYQEVARDQSDVVTTLKGNHDKTPAHELGKLVWSVVEVSLMDQRNQVLKELETAVNAQKYSSAIGEVWRMAKEGRGSTLIVEEGFHYAARVDEYGMILTPASDVDAPDVIDDAVDEVIEMVLAKGGRVVFVEDGTLSAHQRIALILRY